MPGMMPRASSSCGNGVPSWPLWRIVSSYRMTPLMYSSTPGVVKSMSRYARRFSSVDSMPIESKRFLIVPVLSSAARMPLPSATSALAVSCSSVAMSQSPVVVSPSRLLLPRCERGEQDVPEVDGELDAIELPREARRVAAEAELEQVPQAVPERAPAPRMRHRADAEARAAGSVVERRLREERQVVAVV